MAQLARGQTSRCDDPVLDVFTSVDATPVDVAELSFQVFDVSTTERWLVPLQVFPVEGRAALDPTVDCPDGARIELGHFVATWTAPEDTSLGTHEIRWFFRLAPGASEFQYTEEFEVLERPAAAPARGYCTVTDLRDEGVTEAQASDTRLVELIDEASAEIERLTGWFFLPRHEVYLLDGRGTPTLELPAPPVRIDHLFIGGSEVFIEEDVAVVVGAPVRPSFGAPRISLRHGAVFPKGRGNIEIEGLFGYTEFDGSLVGRTPLAIRRACILLVLRWLHPLTGDASHDARNRWRILEERTRDQSYKLGTVSVSASLSGDPEVDDILLRYRRPPGMGAV